MKRQRRTLLRQMPDLTALCPFISFFPLQETLLRRMVARKWVYAGTKSGCFDNLPLTLSSLSLPSLLLRRRFYAGW